MELSYQRNIKKHFFLFLLQPCIISTAGQFNCASTIVVFSGVTVLCKTLSDKLHRLQNRAGRVLTQSSYEADASQLIQKTRRPKLKAEMVYKSLNGLIPSYLPSKIIIRQQSDLLTSYNLRNSENKLAIPLPRTYKLLQKQLQLQWCSPLVQSAFSCQARNISN